MLILFKRLFELMFRSGTSSRFKLRLYLREFRHLKQRYKHGFDNRELWNLDVTIAEFILPRLKAFKQMFSGHPSDMTEEEWIGILDKMIRSFQIVVDSDFNYDSEEYREGMELFAKYFTHLWD